MARSLRELREEVYDSASHLDENCSLIDEEYWYENDLVLAAELGKTLLERNRQLEGQLVQSQKNTGDQQLEIDLLSKQLVTLRELSENKMRIYEEVDKQSQEIEKTNKRLVNEAKYDKQRIQSLQEQLTTLESRNEDLREQVERFRNQLSSRQREDRLDRCLIKSSSVPNVQAAVNCEARRSPSFLRQKAIAAEENVDEVVQLHDKICELNFQVSSERRKKESMESELRVQVHEQEELRAMVDALRSELLSLQTRAQHDVEDRRLCAESQADLPEDGEEERQEAEEEAAARTPTDAVARDLFSGVEHDIEAVNGPEMGKLKTGGKVFSSRESLNRVGAENTDKGATQAEISLLSELDQQYNKLVRQYETLISTKADGNPQPPQEPQENNVSPIRRTPHRTANLDNSPLSPTTAANQFEKKLNAIFSEETRRQRKTMITPDYRPQYKQLFREAFTVLKDMKGKGRVKTEPDSKC